MRFLDHAVDLRKLNRVADTVDKSRLDNTRLRKQYAAEIALLPTSQPMAELGYA
jgi:hypothetical protein